ncbi:hypothetical protein [Erwinia sp. V71]|uniref:hypothetical protein n=1 Tax=Erwinia sp. V71 TaxID=3369424 RepID=UPI003F60FB38
MFNTPIGRQVVQTLPQSSDNVSMTPQGSELKQHLLGTGNTSQSSQHAVFLAGGSRPDSPTMLTTTVQSYPPAPFREASALPEIPAQSSIGVVNTGENVTPAQTAQALKAWLAQAITYPAKQPVGVFFAHHGVKSWHHYANRHGLNKNGELFLANQALHQERRQQPFSPRSLVEALLTWDKMSPDERRHRTLRHYFGSCGIENRSIGLYATVQDGVTDKGWALIIAERTEEQQEDNTGFLRLTSALDCLLQFADCRALQLRDFAVATKVSYGMVRRYWVARRALSESGKAFYHKNKGLQAALLKWKNASQDQRERWTLHKFAWQHRIAQFSWHRYACIEMSGLTNVGEALLNVPGPEALRQDVLAFLQRRQCNEQALAITDSLSPSPTVAVMVQSATQPGAGTPLMAVKQEPADSDADESCWEPSDERLHLALKKNGPLLADPRDPTRSITADVFKHSELKLFYAPGLDASLKQQSARFQKQFLRDAKNFIHWLIKTDGSRQDNYLKHYVNEPEITFIADPQHPDTDIPAPAGIGLTARIDIKPFTILGGYNGVLLSNEADIQHEQRKIGAERSLAHSWAAPENQDGPRIVTSAFLNAGLLTLVNTNQMAGMPLLNEQGIAGDKGNNLSVIFVDNFFPVYVTIKEITAGDRLLLPYGRGFNPLAVKQESLACDDEAIVARYYQQPLIIQDGAGNELRGYNSAGEQCAQQRPLRRTLILRQRYDTTGKVWYDAVSHDGLRLATSPDNDDNIWHALACALAPKAPTSSLAGSMAHLKSIVADEKKKQGA